MLSNLLKRVLNLGSQNSQCNLLRNRWPFNRSSIRNQALRWKMLVNLKYTLTCRRVSINTKVSVVYTWERKDSSKHTIQKKKISLKKIWVKVRITIFLKSRRNKGFGFWIPPSPNHWEGSPNFKQLFILYGLWAWQLSAIFWLCLFEQKAYFTVVTSCFFLWFYSSSHHPNPLKAEWPWHVREGPCWPHDQYLGWGRKCGKSLWILLPHFWV